MKWAFVDYENVGDLKKINLSHYEKVIVFVGAKQKMISFGDTIYTKPIEFTYIKIAEVQKNNLDLHLAYYLSDYNHIAPGYISFDVISNDRDFTPLIKHINLNIRRCVQVRWDREVKDIQKVICIKGEKKKVSHLINNITYIPIKARPKKITALYNHIKTYMRIKENVELEVQKYVHELIEEGILNVDNKLIKYNW